MSILRTVILAALLAPMISSLAQDDLDRALVPKSAEQKVTEAIKSPELSVVHLWAPWCSNCLAELKSGGWAQMAKANPQVKFYFVSVWDNGDDGAAIAADVRVLLERLLKPPSNSMRADSGAKPARTTRKENAL